MKQIKRIVVCALVILAAFFYAHISKANAVYDRQSDNSTYGIAENTGLVIEQKFVCKEASMDAIQVKCQVQQAGEGNVTLTLTDLESGKTVASSTKALSEIKNGKWNTFSFETVGNCKGKTYQMVLEGEALTCFVQQGIQPETELLVNGAEQDGTLLMKTVTKRFDIETFGVFLILVLYVYFFFRFLKRLFSR